MADEFDEKSSFMRSHRTTWEGFTKLLTWSVIGTIAVLVLLAILTL